MKQLKLIYILLFFVSVGGSNLLYGQQFISQQNNTSQLASKYYMSGEYEKASQLYLKLYEQTNMASYFNSYVSCMVRSEKYDDAEKELRRFLRKNPSFVQYHITLGNIYKVKQQLEKQTASYKKAIELVRTKSQVSLVFNNFLNSQEFEWGEKTLIGARKHFPNDRFYYEYGRLYRIRRDYEKMSALFLDWLKEDGTRLSIIQSYFNSALVDLEGEQTAKIIEKNINKAIEEEPDYYPYQRLKAWMHITKDEYEEAFLLLRTLNVKTQKENNQLFMLARKAQQNEQFEVAQQIYNYMIALGKHTSYFRSAWRGLVMMSFAELETISDPTLPKIDAFIATADKALNQLGNNATNYQFVKLKAHVLAFYKNNIARALDILNGYLDKQRLSAVVVAEMKMELADIYVIADDPWQATLFYSQAINQAKNHPIADEAKWKKARLGFLIGDFNWAKAQLDAIKGSTSKLTSNNAIDLAMLIGNNMNLDTTEITLKHFARIEYNIIKRKEDLAIQSIDSLMSLYPDHSIVDEALFRKAEILTRKQQYDKAIDVYKLITDNYASDQLADDAMYQIASLYRDKLNKQEEARNWFRELIIRYSSSAYANEARKQYQDLENKEPL